jgi:hypothetical protein
MHHKLMNLFEAIFSQERLDRTAILHERRRISYAELREQTLSLAGALRVLAVELGDLFRQWPRDSFLHNPMWRGQTKGSYFLVFNAILNFDNLNAGRKLDEK